MMKLAKILSLLFVGIYAFSLTGVALAQDSLGSPEIEKKPPDISKTSELKLDNPLCIGGGKDCANDDIPGLIESITAWLIKIGGVLAVGMIIWGAIQMITAAGSPEKFSDGKKTILYTVIGYVIILIGYGVVSIIKAILTVE